MIPLIQNTVKNLNLKPKEIQIDNLVFKLHYIVTCGLLLTFCSIITGHEYIGEKIRCTHSDTTDSSKALDHVMDTFCFFMSTYVVTKHLNKTESSEMSHPGVGPHENEDKMIKNTYYQWVPYVVFLQAWSFFIPHLIWKGFEGGRIKALVKGFNVMEFIRDEVRRKREELPTEEKGALPRKYNEFQKIMAEFNDRIIIYRWWFVSLCACEVLNLANLILQIWLTDWFLGGKFWNLGSFVVEHYNDENSFRPLDIVFPKVAKCNFKKYGPSGSIQTQDILCVLSLNVINEKMYLTMWFWYLILLIATILQLLHRILSVSLYKTTFSYNLTTVRSELTIKPSRKHLETVMKNLTFSEFFFLRVLGSNMNGSLFKELIEVMAKNLKMYGERTSTEQGLQKPFHLDNANWFYEPYGLPLSPAQPSQIKSKYIEIC